MINPTSKERFQKYIGAIHAAIEEASTEGNTIMLWTPDIIAALLAHVCILAANSEGTATQARRDAFAEAVRKDILDSLPACRGLAKEFMSGWSRKYVDDL